MVFDGLVRVFFDDLMRVVLDGLVMVFSDFLTLNHPHKIIKTPSQDHKNKKNHPDEKINKHHDGTIQNHPHRITKQHPTKTNVVDRELKPQ